MTRSATTASRVTVAVIKPGFFVPGDGSRIEIVEASPRVARLVRLTPRRESPPAAEKDAPEPRA